MPLRRNTSFRQEYTRPRQMASAREAGLADFEAPTRSGGFLPQNASEPIIRKLNQAAFATSNTRSVQERLKGLAAPVPEAQTPAW